MSQFWEGILDVAPTVPHIWLSREKDEDIWKPLRKEDCRVLNHNAKLGKKEVNIDGGRSTVNLETNTITHHFYNYPPKKVCKANWFIVNNQKKPIIYEPVLPLEDAEKIEDLYQKTLNISSPLAVSKDKKLSEEVLLSSPGDFKAVVSRTSDKISIRKKPVAGFGAMIDKGKLLQRGYGNYTVKGEEEELSLGPVGHIVFVVHGIGEALWSSQDNDIVSMRDSMTGLREEIHKKQYNKWKNNCERHQNRKLPGPLPPLPNRIEIIPIEWYDSIRSSSNSLMKSLNAVTLDTIPSLRAVANDVVFDVLMYMTPEFCYATLESVTSQINTKLAKFKEVHPHFKPDQGNKHRISIIGHSLGSVIVWDLLSIKKMHLEGIKRKRGTNIRPSMSGFSVFQDDDEENDNPNNDTYKVQNERVERWTPSLPKMITKHINFEPEFTFFLGSPLGNLLTLRGAHEEFDEMINTKKKVIDLTHEDDDSPNTKTATEEIVDDMISPFTLPTRSLYNIFHPYDPVAYRIEPLLLSRDLEKDEIPAPAVLATQDKGIRLHVQAKQFQEGVMKNWKQMMNNNNSVRTSNENKKQSNRYLKENDFIFPLGGKNKRVDFQLQMGLIEYDYLSAMSAHTSYWEHEDMVDFLAQLATSDE